MECLPNLPSQRLMIKVFDNKVNLIKGCLVNRSKIVGLFDSTNLLRKQIVGYGQDEGWKKKLNYSSRLWCLQDSCFRGETTRFVYTCYFWQWHRKRWWKENCGVEHVQVEFNLLFFQFGRVWTKDKRMHLNKELRYNILLILFFF